MLIPNNAIYWYDLESYMNLFSCCIERDCDGAKWQFEISDWFHQGVELNELLLQIKASGGRLGGFNNYGFDYPLLHMLMQVQGNIDSQTLKHKCNYIIACGKAGDRFSNNITDKHQYVPQLDLMKIHHFDNIAKATSLKILEFNMRMDDIIELPYPPEKILTYDESREILTYNWHDVTATKKFGRISQPMIEYRDELTLKWDHNFTNNNNGKVGCDIFIMELRKAGVNVKQNIQSPREYVNTGEILLPYIQFEHPEFKRMHEAFKHATVPTVGDGIKEFFATNREVFQADLNGFPVQLGGGGVHASLSKQIVESDDEYVIIDSDVTSFYPRLGIVNKYYPEHLSVVFCTVYDYLFNERKKHPKGSMENAAFKEALNIPYGKSNDIYSPFYDPKYTLSITINGQLLLCMLAEQLAKVPNLSMIQFNTDGLSYKVPRKYVNHCMRVSKWWEDITGLELEHEKYSKMVIRDVNNYMAHYEGTDKIKRKGDYNSVNLEWNKDHSQIVVAKAAEAALMRGENIAEFIHSHDDMFDFCLRTKLNKTSYLLAGEKREQNVTRYYVSTDGVPLTKVMPYTDKILEKWNTVAHWVHRDNGKHVNAPKAPSGKYDLSVKPSQFPPDRKSSIRKGYVVEVCNSVTGVTFNNIDYDYYINETEKLVLELQGK
jgi:hypothetical protein